MKNLLNKAKPSYREIRPMRGRLMRGPPVICERPLMNYAPTNISGRMSTRNQPINRLKAFFWLNFLSYLIICPRYCEYIVHIIETRIDILNQEAPP